MCHSKFYVEADIHAEICDIRGEEIITFVVETGKLYYFTEIAHHGPGIFGCFSWEQLFISVLGFYTESNTESHGVLFS